MAEPGPAAEQRPSKRPKNIVQDWGPDLRADRLLKYSLQLPQSFTPGAIQANRLALRAQEDRCLAYVANAQHVYEVSLGSHLSTATAASSAASATSESGCVERGKEGVLVPRAAQVGHVRQLDALSYMTAEVQGLYAGVHGAHHLLAAVDAVGNARLLATPLGAGQAGTEAEADGAGLRACMSLRAPYRGECGWTGLAVRSLGAAVTAAEDGGGGGGGGGAPPVLEVAVARQRLRDVNVYRDGVLARTLHTMQGPTALTYLPPLSGGASSAADPAVSGLLAVAEEHQVSLWDVRQGERGGCTQRLNVYGGGSPVFSLSWVAAAAPSASRPNGGGSGGGGGGSVCGLLAAAGWERSVVMLEPRKWHILAKWPGCVKYPATHLAPSAVAPGFVYVAGLDYEAVAGRWDGSCGGSAGNANSGSGGHGRATGPPQLKQQFAAAAAAGERREAATAVMMAMDDGAEGGGSRGGLSFRGDSKWLGLARESLPCSPRTVDGAAVDGGGEGGGCGTGREVAAALSLSGHLFVLVASASTEAPDA